MNVTEFGKMENSQVKRTETVMVRLKETEPLKEIDQGREGHPETQTLDRGREYKPQKSHLVYLIIGLLAISVVMNGLTLNLVIKGSQKACKGVEENPNNWPQLVQLQKNLTAIIENKLNEINENVLKIRSGGKTDLSPVLDSLGELKTFFKAPPINETPPINRNEAPLVTYEDHLKLFWLTPKLDLLKDYSDNPYIGGSWTRIAIKNHDSYLIGSKGKGILVIENGKTVYEGAFSSTASDIYNTVYVKDCDCYFLILSGKLYKKSIDSLAPQLWINGGFEWPGWGQCASLLYSEKTKRIVTIKRKRAIAIIDPNQKEVEFELEVDFADEIREIRFFGEKDQNLVFLAYNRHVGVLEYDPTTKKGEIISKIHYSGQIVDFGISLDIDSTNKIILVTNSQNNQITRVVALEFWGKRLTQTAELHVHDGTRWMGSFSFVESYKNQALFLGVSSMDGGTTHVYRYDSFHKRITDEVQKRVVSREQHVWGFVKYGDSFIFSGDRGLLMSAKLVDGREQAGA